LKESGPVSFGWRQRDIEARFEKGKRNHRKQNLKKGPKRWCITVITGDRAFFNCKYDVS
jgi:hypothetical protein